MEVILSQAPTHAMNSVKKKDFVVFVNALVTIKELVLQGIRVSRQLKHLLRNQ